MSVDQDMDYTMIIFGRENETILFSNIVIIVNQDKDQLNTEDRDMDYPMTIFGHWM